MRRYPKKRKSRINKELSDLIINEKGEIYKKVGPRFHKATTWQILYYM